MKKREKTRGRFRRQAGKKILEFYHEIVGSSDGVKVNECCFEILKSLGKPTPDTFRTDDLRRLTLDAIAEADGSRAEEALPVRPTFEMKRAFYASWEWSILRMKALKANDGRCECCGAGRDDETVGGLKVRLHVDHIQPLALRWDLRLEGENLQVLCGECNKGKGAWDFTDWRKASYAFRSGLHH